MDTDKQQEQKPQFPAEEIYVYRETFGEEPDDFADIIAYNIGDTVMVDETMLVAKYQLVRVLVVSAEKSVNVVEMEK